MLTSSPFVQLGDVVPVLSQEDETSQICTHIYIYIYSLCSPLVLGLLNSLPVYGPLSLAFDNILHPFQAVQNASWMKTWRFCLHSVGCG